MTGAQPTNGKGRRERWAGRENAQREAAYRESLATWQAEAAELDWMAATARSFAGSAHASVALKRNEAVFMEYSAARLVEVQRSTGNDLGGSSGFSYRAAKAVHGEIAAGIGSHVPGAEQLKITDVGPVTVTNQRVILHGSRHPREWVFAKLLGIWHDDTRPVTLMQVSNRQKVSGLIYTASDAARFRYFLGLALAHHQGNVAGFIAELDAERDRHAALAPAAPVPVGPEDAPSGLRAVGTVLGVLYFGRAGWPRKWRIAQGIATVSLTLTAFVAAAGASQPSHPSVASQPSTQISLATGAASQDSTRTSTSRARSSSPNPTLHAAPLVTTAAPGPSHLATIAPPLKASVTSPPYRSIAPTRAPPPPPRTSSQVVLSTCGAPANPWGYNFCGRGSYIYNPASDVCSYFSCIANFANGVGYMTQCNDGEYSMSGGRSGACSYHRGEAQPVFSGSGPH